MSTIRTLRNVSGLGDTPCSLASAALIMVDCQNTYRTGVMQLEGVEAAIQQARLLLERARELKSRVIHIQHDAGPGSPYDVRADVGAISAEVAPRPGEPVVVKAYPNAFVQTDLDARLKARGVKSDVIAGFMTHMCINSTPRGAFNLGYSPTVVASATATRALPGAAGSTISAAAIQIASLAALRDLFAVVVDDPDGLLVPPDPLKSGERHK